MSVNPQAPPRGGGRGAPRTDRRTGPEPEPKTNSYLQPGKIVVGRGPAAVKTVLGSCVAVCLWDPGKEIGGMNHYLLPLRATRSTGTPRFGEIAIMTLLDELQKLGARPGALRARVYGGACVVATLRNSSAGVGPRNIELAERVLAKLNIPILSKDVGGRTGRRVVFRLGDGAVWVRQLVRGGRR